MTPDQIAERREQIKAQHLKPEGERPPSSARGLHHFALVSGDAQRTVDFYQGGLEFPLTKHGNLLAFFDFPGLDVEPREVLGGLHHVAISVDPER